ncbi:MAG: hypothetical protein ACREM1_23805 [Longimicrobiales bacterium]
MSYLRPPAPEGPHAGRHRCDHSRYRPPTSDRRNRYKNEPYDGLGPHDLGDLLDWQMHGAELPEPERSAHCELSDVEIARWDARVDRWVRAHGGSLDDELAPAAARPRRSRSGYGVAYVM